MAVIGITRSGRAGWRYGAPTSVAATSAGGDTGLAPGPMLGHLLGWLRVGVDNGITTIRHRILVPEDGGRRR